MADGIVVVQLIEVTWNKIQRHAQAATHRNQLPDAFPLPSCQHKADMEILVHHVQIDQRGARTETMTQFERLGLANLRHIELNLAGKVLHVLCRPDLKWTELARPRLAVTYSQWGKVIVEEGSAAAGYRKITHNISFSEAITPLIFLNQPPVREVHDSHRLAQ